jgi:hypothetical protein
MSDGNGKPAEPAIEERTICENCRTEMRRMGDAWVHCFNTPCVEPKAGEGSWRVSLPEKHDTSDSSTSAEGEKTEEAQGDVDEHPDLPKPICPHCLADPCRPQFRQFNIGPIRGVIFFCSACHKPIPVFMLPAAPPRVLRPGGMPPGARIVRPQ